MSDVTTIITPRPPNRARSALLVSVWLLASSLGCSGTRPPAAHREQSAVEPPEAMDRQILVTVKQPSPAPIRGAGSTSMPYLGAADYTISERTRRVIARLARTYRLRELQGWPIRALGVYCVVFEVADERSVAEVVEELESDRRIESVQPMQRFEVLASYDDPYVDMQHGLDAMRIWDVHPWTGGRGITVAVVDTGVDRAHPDLAGSVAMAKNFVGQRRRPKDVAELHGTAVAGIIASTANNGIGTVGVAPGSRILALRACWERGDTSSPGACNTFTLAKALAFVVDRRPDVVNLSLTGPRDPLLERLVRAALDKGVAVVTAYEQGSDAASFPGLLDGVMAVQSAAAAATLSEPASLLRAPGQDILTTAPGDRFDFVSGSSFAAAHVSGVVALLLERAPGLDVERLHKILYRTSRSVPGPEGVATLLVDACAALEQVAPEARCERDSDG